MKNDKSNFVCIVKNSSFLVLIHIMLYDYREFLQREHKEITKQNDSDIHKEPLKMDGSSMNSGLERSYSSPNLLQV